MPYFSGYDLVTAWTFSHLPFSLFLRHLMPLSTYDYQGGAAVNFFTCDQLRLVVHLHVCANPKVRQPPSLHYEQARPFNLSSQYTVAECTLRCH